MAKKTHLLKLILTSLLLGADNGTNATELMGQWYMTSSGDRLITYYGPKEECEVYGSLEAVNQTMEAVRGMYVVKITIKVMNSCIFSIPCVM